MEQTASVSRIIDGTTAEILVERKSACSGDCDHCGGCAAVSQTVKAEAINEIHAEPGARVVVRCETKTVLRSAALVYFVPIGMFFIGYALGSVLDFYPGLVSLGFMLLGMIQAILVNRDMKKAQRSMFTIVRYAEEYRGTGESIK